MDEKREYKTKDYVRRATNNYRAKFDQVSLQLPKGTKDYIRENAKQPVNVYIKELVLKDLKEKYGYDPTE